MKGIPYYLSLLALLFWGFSADKLSKEEQSKILKEKIEDNKANYLEIGSNKITYTNKLSGIYKEQNFNLLWSKELAANLLTEVKEAHFDGLKPTDYHLNTIQDLLYKKEVSNLDMVNLELLLSDAFILYARHLLSGKVSPTDIDKEWKPTPKDLDAGDLLLEATSTGNFKGAFINCRPKHQEYYILKSLFRKLLSMQDKTWITIPNGPTIKPLKSDERIPDIRKRLIYLGDLASASNITSQEYDKDLVSAVIRFQTRHGLDTEGNIGEKTIGALNISIEQRISTVKANLERWRWLTHELGEYHLRVNIPGFELQVFKNNKVERTHKIIAGRPTRKTPVFSSELNNMVFNPTWTVPPGILNADVIPAAKKDLNYLSSKNLIIYDKNGAVVDPKTIDWNSSQAKQYTYRQPAGDNNALGVVKFMFPNPYSVYLHDTPSKELFEKSDRSFSSGCIRVQHPVDLATYLLSNQGEWNKEKVEKVIASKKTETVTVKNKPLIHLTYWTAWVDENGIVNYRNDIYDRDSKIVELLSR